MLLGGLLNILAPKYEAPVRFLIDKDSSLIFYPDTLRYNSFFITSRVSRNISRLKQPERSRVSRDCIHMLLVRILSFSHPIRFNNTRFARIEIDV